MSAPTTRPFDNECAVKPSEPLSLSIHGDQMRADRGGRVTKIVKVLRDNTQFIIGLLMALLVIESAALFYDWRYKAQQSELARQELKDFQTFVYDPKITDIASQVKSDHDLIQAYGLSKAITDNCRR